MVGQSSVVLLPELEVWEVELCVEALVLGLGATELCVEALFRGDGGRDQLCGCKVAAGRDNAGGRKGRRGTGRRRWEGCHGVEGRWPGEGKHAGSWWERRWGKCE
jgi:hypothetical protein